MMRIVRRGDKSLIQKDHFDRAYQFDVYIVGSLGVVFGVSLWDLILSSIRYEPFLERRPSSLQINDTGHSQVIFRITSLQYIQELID